MIVLPCVVAVLSGFGSAYVDQPEQDAIAPVTAPVLGTAAAIVEHARAAEAWLRDLDRFHLRMESITDHAPETIEARRRALERLMGRGNVPDDHPELVPRQESWLEIVVEIEPDVPSGLVRVRRESTFGGRHVLDVFDGSLRTTRNGGDLVVGYALEVGLGNLGDQLLLGLAWPRTASHEFRWGHHRMIDDPADAFRLVGRDEAMGVDCHVLEARAGFTRWHVGVDDGLLRRQEVKVIGPGTAVDRVLRGIGERHGTTIADWRAFSDWQSTLPADAQESVMAEYWRELAPTARTMVVYELGDYTEIAPGKLFPALQRITMPGDATAGATQTLRIVRFDLDPSIDDALFAIEVPAGAWVDDVRYDVPLHYRHDPDRTDEEFGQMLDKVRAGMRESRDAMAARDALIGEAAPPLPEAAHWHNSDALTWEALRGKAVVICFFADWCGPCRSTFATTAEWWEERRTLPENANITIIGVHTADGTPQRVATLAETRELGYPIVTDRPEAGHFGTFARAFGVRGIPQAFLVDPEGRIAAHGMADEMLRRASMMAPREPVGTSAEE